MIKKTIFISSLLFVSSFANANIALDLSYKSLSHDESIDTSAITLGVGYSFEIIENFDLTPAFSIGKGVSDDKFSTTYVAEDGFSLTPVEATVEIDNIYEISLKASYSFSDNLSVYVNPSYLKTEYSSTPESNLDFFFIKQNDDWELGLGIGLEYLLKENMLVGVSYSSYDKANVTGVTVAYLF